MNTQRKKRCVVKCCKNTNSNAPEKLFLNLPPAEPGAELTERRMKWEQALENRLSSWSRSSYDKICEDHFNLQEDSSNWMRYKTVGCNIQLKPEVVPHLYMDNPPTYALKSQLSESDQKRRTEFLLSFKKQSSSRSQSSPRTKIPDTPMLMQIDAIKLPTTFDYSKISENTYRANLLSENDIKIWIKEFEKLTSTSWIIILHKNNTPHLVSSYVFYCHHTGYRRVTPSNNKKGKSKNFDCRANIKIRIKMTTKNTIRKDKFVKDGMPATIVFNYNHNHDLNSAETLSYLPPSKEIRQEFEKYFEDGSSIKEAINYHKSKLELKYGPESAELVNSQINPKYRSVQFWFEEWRTKNLGPRSGDGVVQLEQDAENWMFYKTMGRRLVLKPDVVPHKLINARASSYVPPVLTDSAKKRKMENISNLAKKKLIIEMPPTQPGSSKSVVRQLFVESESPSRPEPKQQFVSSPSGVFEVSMSSAEKHAFKSVAVQCKLRPKFRSVATNIVTAKVGVETKTSIFPPKRSLCDEIGWPCVKGSPSISLSSETSQEVSDFSAKSSTSTGTWTGSEDVKDVMSKQLNEDRRRTSILLCKLHSRFFLGVPKESSNII